MKGELVIKKSAAEGGAKLVRNFVRPWRTKYSDMNFPGRGNSAFSTLEILIAFAVFSLSMSSTLMLVFSNRIIATEIDLGNQALLLAKENLENAKTSGSGNFSSLVSTSSPISDSIYGGIFSEALNVSSLTPCLKNIESEITWQSDNRPQSVALGGLIPSKNELEKFGNDCGGFPNLLTDWTNPKNNTIPISQIGTPNGIDVKNGMVYMVASSTSTTNDLFIFDTKNLSETHFNTGPGLLAVDVVGDYAYLSNASSTEQILVANILNPNNVSVIGKVTLPQVSGSCPYTCPYALTLFYYDAKLYVGTHRLVANGANEFHIYDVSNPANPSWLTSLNLDANINSVFVYDGKAYLANSGDSKELIVIDVDPTSLDYLKQVAIFDAPGTEDATSVYVLGGKLFLGRVGQGLSKTTEPEFLVLDITDPLSIKKIDSANLNLATTDGVFVSAIRTVGNTVFLGTTYSKKPFFVYDLISHTLTSGTWSGTLPLYGMDIEDDTIFQIGPSTLKILTP